VFDALPPGRYALEIDASAASEPLRPVGETPTLEVADGRRPPESTIMLRARSLKIRQMSKETP